MVLCQILISTPNLTLYPINVFGNNKRVKIVRIDYRYNAGGQDKIIVIQSNILRLPLSNYPYFLFSANNNHQIGNINGDLVYEDVNFNGNLDIMILDAETQAVPTNFVTMVLTLDISDK
jgi:hypothetical protein